MKVEGIPPSDFLEQHYDRQEVLVLEQFRPLLARLPVAQRRDAGRAMLRRLWSDEIEVIEKTHWITTKEAGPPKQLRLNYAQRRFYRDVIQKCRSEGRPTRAVILKARQLGFSTFIQSWQYEQCDREPTRRAMTVSYDDESTKELFAKSAFIYDHQWFPRERERGAQSLIEFADNRSTFYTRTAGSQHAGRSLTIHHLHCSELPMWPSGESLVGLLDAVPVKAETSIFFESTAKGRQGDFYDAWSRAESGESDFVPFFAPWFWDPDYQLGFASDDQRRAFARSLTETEQRLVRDYRVSFEQLNWRRYKISNDPKGSEAKFRQEFPSNAEEAFLTSGSPVFDADRIIELERNIAPPFWVGNIHAQKSEGE